MSCPFFSYCSRGPTPARPPQRGCRVGDPGFCSAASAFAEASADRRSLGGGWSRLARAAGASTEQVEETQSVRPVCYPPRALKYRIKPT